MVQKCRGAKKVQLVRGAVVQRVQWFSVDTEVVQMVQRYRGTEVLWCRF